MRYVAGSICGQTVLALVAAAACSTIALGDSLYVAEIFVPTFEDGSIRRINPDGSNEQTLVPTGGGLRSVAVDPVAGKIYWTDVNQFAIRRSNLDGSGVQDIVTSGLVFPAAIAVDSAGGKIYWGDQVDEAIYRANLDGTDVQQVISTPFYRGIAVDPAAGRVYWTTSATPTRGDIRRCNLDGSAAETIVLGANGFKPTSIALDVAAGMIYWTDGVARLVRRAELNGANVQTIYPSGNTTRGITLDPLNQLVFWGEDVGDEPTIGWIFRMPYSGAFAEVIAPNLGLVNGLAFAAGDAPTPCPADLNGDRTIDLTDLAMLLSNFGSVGPGLPGDIDGDDDVDLSDLATLLAVFGTNCP